MRGAGVGGKPIMIGAFPTGAEGTGVDASSSPRADGGSIGGGGVGGSMYTMSSVLGLCGGGGGGGGAVLYTSGLGRCGGGGGNIEEPSDEGNVCGSGADCGDAHGHRTTDGSFGIILESSNTQP